MFIIRCVCEWVTAVYIDTVELPFITNVRSYLPMFCHIELWALRITQLIGVACSGTVKICVLTGTAKEQRNNVNRGKVIQKAAKCVTSLHWAALCCWCQHTAPFACVFHFIEPFWTVLQPHVTVSESTAVISLLEL